MQKLLSSGIFSTWTRNKLIFLRLLDSCFQISFVSKVAGTQLYDWSLQGYIAVESLWKDNPKKKKSGKKGDKVRRLRNLIWKSASMFSDEEIILPFLTQLTFVKTKILYYTSKLWKNTRPISISESGWKFYFGSCFIFLSLFSLDLHVVTG